MINKLYCIDISTFNPELLADIEPRSKAFKSDKRKREYLASNWLRYTVFSEILAIEKEHLKFSKDVNDRPFLQLKNHKHYDFNISHSGKWLILAVTDQDRIGIDIEEVVDKYSFLTIAERFFSKEETLILKTLQPPEQRNYFYLIWTLKEAALKCSGQGIAKGLNKVNFIFDKKQIIPSNNACGYQYISFRLDDAHIGSVCLKSEAIFSPSMLQCYQFDLKENIEKVIPFDLDVIKTS